MTHIWGDALNCFREENWTSGPLAGYRPNSWWRQIAAKVARERGLFCLGSPNADPNRQCWEFLCNGTSDDVLDVIEVSFKLINSHRFLHQQERDRFGICHPDLAIKELNLRFREHSLGYEFTANEIVRIDSKFIHAEAVKPALALLLGAGKSFDVALGEFLEAHMKFRKGELRDAIADALKAMESTLKAICTERKWSFDAKKDTAKRLLEIVFENSLVPDYLQAQFGGLRSVLESGVPTVRNRTSGHGGGVDPLPVTDHLTQFVLHSAASNIVFLIESHKAMR